MMINRPLEERMVDPADVDDDATDADKKNQIRISSCR